ncbi:MAG: signal peptidase I [Anaerolineae bacterium]
MAELHATPTPTPAGEAQRAGLPGWLHEIVYTFLPAVAIVLVINLFLAQPRTVHGESMAPNLHENQRVIVDMVTYRLRAPDRGEVIVLDLPARNSDPLIKRVVGLPGDVVEIKQGSVFVNGNLYEEPYLSQTTAGAMEPRVVPEAHVFVLGDNRCCSNDSRFFGMVPYEDVLGRAWLRYWPPSEIGAID